MASPVSEVSGQFDAYTVTVDPPVGNLEGRAVTQRSESSAHLENFYKCRFLRYGCQPIPSPDWTRQNDTLNPPDETEKQRRFFQLEELLRVHRSSLTISALRSIIDTTERPEAKKLAEEEYDSRCLCVKYFPTCESQADCVDKEFCSGSGIPVVLPFGLAGSLLCSISNHAARGMGGLFLAATVAPPAERFFRYLAHSKME